ncbi:hypothetical protein BGX34_010012 [Mortierella sp. NVP85]|nr:hypothetical protein BGX34_010012 [Mortierella sp. NVP85]
MFPVSGSISVLEIPLLLDMICARLDSKDIKACARCSKAWYSYFGPYRFKFVRLTHSASARTLFMLENSYYIRELELNLSNFEAFNSPHCTRLHKLALGFVYEKGEESDECDSDDARCDELDTLEGVEPTPRPSKPLCAAELIQRNQGLRTFHIVQGGCRDQSLRPVAKPILQAIASHPFLTTISITMKLICPVLLKILNHLPQHLQELDIGVKVENYRHHQRCVKRTRLLEFQGTPLGLQRLVLRESMNCFMKRAFLPLLRRCPNLEELTLPCTDEWQDYSGLAQVLDTQCKCLRTLNQEQRRWGSLSSSLVCAILQGFTHGFQQLRLYNVHWRPEDSILEKLLISASVNTIEVLRICSTYDKSEHVIGILRQCPCLREFRTHGGNRDFDGTDVSDLVSSMAQPWKCWDTLEILGLEVCNWRAVHEQPSAKARRRKMIQDTRQLCLQLRSLPKLVSLDMRWRLLATRKKPRSDITLDELNQGAAKKGSVLITEEDMVWIGLSRF